ncbi:MAG: glucokinase [Bradymonadia bacterium]
MRLLAGDVGGTHTRLTLYEGPADQPPQASATAVYKSQEFTDLAPVIRAFLREHALAPPEGACIGVAGPVRQGRVRLTNVNWQLDAIRLSADLGFPITLINDFHAQAAAIPHLGPHDLVALETNGSAEPEAEEGAPIAILGPGTGLGEALLIPETHGGYRVLPTEGGHSRFAPRDEREIGLLRSLWQTFPEHVSVERVLSGNGLVAIYDYLRGDTPRRPEMATTDPAAVITTQALARGCPICVEAVEMFVAILGDEAANLALKSNAGGGVYIAGGIGPRIAPLMQGTFRRAFITKGRFGSWLRGVPTWLIIRTDSGMLGAWAEAHRLASQPHEQSPERSLMESED